MSVTIIEAAAGTGKTVELTRQYLQHLKAGLHPSEILAVTFTRKAAAELIERIAGVLEGIRGIGPARPKLDLELYRDYAPADPAMIETALVALPTAPIGTLDSVVHRLVTEFVLDARVPAGDGVGFPLDIPLVPSPSSDADLLDAAQTLLHELDADGLSNYSELLRHNSIAEVATLAAAPRASRALVPTDNDAILDAVAAAIPGLREALYGALVTEMPPTSVEGWTELIRTVNTRSTVERLDSASMATLSGWLVMGGRPPGRLVFNLLSRFGPKTGRDVARRLGKAVDDDDASPLSKIRVELDVLGERVLVPVDGLCDAADVRSLEVAPTAERLRRELDVLRSVVTHRALERAARHGRVSFDDLLATATALVTAPGHPLGLRFNALLVDEMQDSNPEQIGFYRALLAANPAIDATVVGDERQSIYLFRGAVPTALHALKPDLTRSLPKNYRSTAELVAAQRALFGPALSRALADHGLPALADLSHLEAKHVAGDSRPVTLVIPPDTKGDEVSGADMADHILDRFAASMARRWEAAPCTAVVLVSSWSQAAHAAEVLGARLPGRVFVDGSDGWMKSRVVQDLVILLTAFGDSLDGLAWLGLWKLPPIGLSDRALARACSPGRFVKGAKGPRIGRLHVEATLPGPDQDPRDLAAFELARPVVAAALELAQSGRLCEAIERVASDLGWRELLSVSPVADAEAHFDTALEWVRELELGGYTVLEIADVLGSEKPRIEPPVLRLHRPQNHVSVTSIHQAKGLEWDHVCVPYLAPPFRSDHGPSPELTLPSEGTRRPAPVRLIGVKLDPLGGLAPDGDVQAQLNAKVQSRRKEAERVRLVYVAITRASLTVLTGLPNKEATHLQKILLEAWGSADLAGVERVAWEQPKKSTDPARAWITPKPDAAPVATPMSPTWLRAKPSELKTNLPDGAPRSLADQIASVALRDGFTPGTALIASPERYGAEREFGDLVHGWFAEWGFEGPPTRAAIAHYLTQRWTTDDPALIDFVERISVRVEADADSPWRLSTAPSVERYFELPTISVVDIPSRKLLVAGRTDLLVRDPATRTWTVIDFKAGTHFPSSPADLVSGATLSTYGPQLEGYAAALNQAFATSPWAGERVTRCILWFVRAGASVTWAPVGLGEKS